MPSCFPVVLGLLLSVLIKESVTLSSDLTIEQLQKRLEEVNTKISQQEQKVFSGHRKRWLLSGDDISRHENKQEEKKFEFSQLNLQDQDFSHIRTLTSDNDKSMEWILNSSDVSLKCAIESKNKIQLVELNGNDKGGIRKRSIVAINDHYENQVTLMAVDNCSVLAEWSGFLIKYPFIADRTNKLNYHRQDKNEDAIYFVSSKDQICTIDWQSLTQFTKTNPSQSSASPECFNFTIEPSSIGGLVRKSDHKKNSSRATIKHQFFIVGSDGIVRQYNCDDGSVVTRVSESSENEQWYVEGTNTKQVVDFYPNPLILQETWIYELDLRNQEKRPLDCPYIQHARQIIVDDVYSDTCYLLTDGNLYTIGLKNSRKKCQILGVISLISENHQRQTRGYLISKDIFFIDGFVYNLTSGNVVLMNNERCDSRMIKGLRLNRYQRNSQHSQYILEYCQCPKALYDSQIDPSAAQRTDSYRIAIFEMKRSSESLDFSVVWIVGLLLTVVGFCYCLLKKQVSHRQNLEQHYGMPVEEGVQNHPQKSRKSIQEYMRKMKLENQDSEKTLKQKQS